MTYLVAGVGEISNFDLLKDLVQVIDQVKYFNFQMLSNKDRK